MARIVLSEGEKAFIFHGVEHDYRSDGRNGREYRSIELETDIVTNASGSARLRLANTDILVGIKAEVDTPFPERPTEGKIEFFVDCSANAAPEFEGRGGEELGTELANSLARTYQSHKAFDLTSLCILPGHQCWKLYVDILVLECGGNLFDAISLSVKAALHSTRVPKIKAASVDGGLVDLRLSDDPNNCLQLDVSNVPCLVTLCKIGEYYIVDPTAEEEKCSTASIILAVMPSSQVTAIFKMGAGSFHIEALEEILSVGHAIGLDINRALVAALQEEESLGKNKERYGFLK